MGRALLLSQCVLCPLIRAPLTISVRQITQFSKVTVQHRPVYCGCVRERLMADCGVELKTQEARVYQSGWVVGGMGVSV